MEIQELTYQPSRRGKHKIFIGMAPGVGKTYRMLEEGQQLKQEGFDVVIGLLEPHGRKDTEEKADGLEKIPLQNIPYQERVLPEMDTEAIIKRAPSLVLVDELAHTNVPGSERTKRYQDVAVILEAGIDVYSTLNIQHIESLNDLVYKLSGVVVRERVPDRVLEEADEIVVIDVTPETLHERLKEGKIYAPHKIDQALQNFFQKRNLVALRELALREIADNVEEEGRNADLYPSCNIQERVLVCVSTNPTSIQLLRRGARIADRMNGRLLVLFVSNPNQLLSKSDALHVEACRHLTHEFGGEFQQVKSKDVVKTISEAAQREKITQVVLGESQRSRWELFCKGSLIQRLMRLLVDVDIHVISS